MKYRILYFSLLTILFLNTSSPLFACDKCRKKDKSKDKPKELLIVT